MMTFVAGIGGVVIISLMTHCTFVSNIRMCTLQNIIIIVDLKAGRLPIGLGGRRRLCATIGARRVRFRR